MHEHDRGQPRLSVSPEVANRLREALSRVGFDEPAVRAALHVAGQAGRARDPLLDGLRLPGGAALSDVIRLFLLGAELSVHRVARCLSPLTLEEATAAGLVHRNGELIAAAVRIEPHGGLLIASDAPDRIHDPDVVAGAVPAAVTLANLTVRRPVNDALDLGTGSGLQALLAASHSRTVVGVDINPRAVRLARLNAMLNAAENLRVELGSWFEPVGDARFDLITANPPFVISPDNQVVYRDSGMPGDDLSRTIVSALPRHLREDGFASILCNWVEPDGASWWERPAGWVGGDGCDVVVIRYLSEDVVTYAARWNAHLQVADRDRFREVIERWLAYYAASGIGRISTGVVVLRRRTSSANWIRGLDGRTPPSTPSGDLILRVFAAQDYLADVVDDEALLEDIFVSPDSQILEQRLVHRDGAFAAEPTVVRLEGGIGLQGTLAPNLIHVVLKLDGSRRLGEVTTEAADDLQLDGTEVAGFRRAATTAVRELLEAGLLIPARARP